MAFKYLLIFLFFSYNPIIAKYFNSKCFTLKNGLKVIVINNKQAPIVTQQIWYKVGSSNDPIGKSGLSHYLEHMMFKGTTKYPAGKFDKKILKIGGRHNAFTSQNFTCFYQEVSKEHLEEIIKLESDRMTNLSFFLKESNTEKKVVLEERLMMIKNQPWAKFLEQANIIYYGKNHPLAQHVLGNESDIKSFTIKNLKRHYRKWYMPNNAILIFAGDISVEAVKPLVQKYYGSIPSRTTPKKSLTLTRILQQSKKLTYRDSKITHPILYFWYPAITYGTSSPKEVLAFSILTNIMFNGPSSKIGPLLLEKKIIADLSFSLSIFSRYMNHFSIATIPMKDFSINELETELLKIITSVIKKGITTKEVETEKKRMLQHIAYEKDYSFAGAHTFGKALSQDFSIELIENTPQNILSVNTKDVNNIAKKIFNHNNLFKIKILPLKTIKDK